MGAAAADERRVSGRADGKRRAVLAGACRVFLSHGFEGASMDAVAAAARVSKMTVYRYFRSKQALFAGVVSDMCDRIVDAGVVETMSRLSTLAALRTFGRRMLKTVFAPETLGLHRIVIAESKRFPGLGRLFYDTGPGASVSLLADYLRRHKTTLAIADPRQAAEEFMALLRGYEHMRALLGLEAALSPRKRDECVERAIQHVLRRPAPGAPR